MSLPNLTKRQAEVLSVVQRVMRGRVSPPTLRKMAEEIGIRSQSTVHEHLRKLAAKGYIEMEGGQIRMVGREIECPRCHHRFDPLGLRG